MAVAALVLGLVAIATSFIPIVNNGSFFLAILGFIFAIVGLVATRKKRPKGALKGKGMAIAGLVLCIVSIVIVVVTQSFFVAAINEAFHTGPSGNVASTTNNVGSTSGKAADFSSMMVGESVTFENGLSVAVTGAQFKLKNFDGSNATCVTITYTNTGSSTLAFSSYDWRGQTADGVLRSETYFAESTNELQAGNLAPGGSITGNVYFDGDIEHVYYYDSILQQESEIGWVLM